MKFENTRDVNNIYVSNFISVHIDSTQLSSTILIRIYYYLLIYIRIEFF